MRPQVTLLALMAPKKTVRKIESPGSHPFRQRHLRETLRLERTSDQEAPARKAQPRRRHNRWRMVARTTSTSAMPSVPAATSRSGPSNVLLGQEQSAANRPGPDAAKQ